MKFTIETKEKFVELKDKILFGAANGNHKHLELNAVWGRLTKGFDTPFDYEYHVAWSDDKKILGVMIVENRSDVEQYICEIQSYSHGVGELLLKSMEKSAYKEVFFIKDWSASKSLTFYYNKLARKHNWIHEKIGESHVYYIKQNN